MKCIKHNYSSRNQKFNRVAQLLLFNEKGKVGLFNIVRGVDCVYALFSNFLMFFAKTKATSNFWAPLQDHEH